KSDPVDAHEPAAGQLVARRRPEPRRRVLPHSLGAACGGPAVTDQERNHLTLAVRRQRERDEVRTALAQSHATETIGRRLGDQLISASREAIIAWREQRNTEARME